jgi:hypothetical protein
MLSPNMQAGHSGMLIIMGGLGKSEPCLVSIKAMFPIQGFILPLSYDPDKKIFTYLITLLSDDIGL